MKSRKKNFRGRIITTLSVIVVTLLILTSMRGASGFLEDYELDNFLGPGKDFPNRPKDMDWYEVMDWEIEICSRGISTDVRNRYKHLSSFNIQSPISQFTWTFQASKSNATNNLTLYEAGYYLQPFEGQGEVPYKLTFIGEENKEVASGKATPKRGKADYKAIYEEDGYYTRAKLSWKIQGRDEHVTLRFKAKWRIKKKG